MWQRQGAHTSQNHATIDRTRNNVTGRKMKFVMAVKKHGKGTATIAKGHNLREYTTNSQLPQSAWITKQGRHTVTAWRDDVMEAAKGLAKRKDAVVAIEVVLQVGNQSDWREMPTAEHPEGKPKPGAAAKLKALHAGAKEAIEREFGKDNVVSIELHTDESTPHVHAMIVPVKDGKLQAKAWLDGPAKCAQLRERLHAAVNRHIECDYSKGEPGGSPHDRSKRAGARVPPPPEPDGWVEKVKGLIDKSDEVKRLKAGIEEVRQQLEKTQRDMATVFSQLKASIKRAERAENRADSAEKQAEKERKEREKTEELARRLKSELDELKPKPKKPLDLGFGDLLTAVKKAPEALVGSAPDGATAQDLAEPQARPAGRRGPGPK